MVKTGLEIFTSSSLQSLKKANFGLLANQASIGPDYEHAITLIDRAFPGRLKTIFGPQHGFAGEKQDNMIESDHDVEKSGRRRIFSLYGETRRPDQEMLEGLDVLLVDLVDIGSRIYTFAQTMAYCLEEAAAAGIKVIVLDRPNPIGGREVEGNILKPDCRSFVGLFPTPMRHGLTMGELALFMADNSEVKPDVEVIKAEGWTRDMYFQDTGLPWVMPSPNMPDPVTAWIYPGQVLWEGTNISEARGTTKPFHLFGAPFIDPRLFKSEIEKLDLPGAHFRVAYFEPTFHKFAGQVCGGLEIHPVNRKEYKPYLTSLSFLEILLKNYPDEFQWKNPPYEYEYERMPIDLILGDRTIREELEKGRPMDGIAEKWKDELGKFTMEREKYLLYN